MPNLGLDVSLAYVPLRKLGPCWWRWHATAI